MISHIHSTTVIVSDQDKARDFYVDRLGWEVAMDSPMGENVRWLTVRPPGAATELVLALSSWFGEQTLPGKNTGISVVAPDVEATYDALVSRGVQFKGPLEPMPWGPKGGWFFDLDGNEFFIAGAS